MLTSITSCALYAKDNACDIAWYNSIQFLLDKYKRPFTFMQLWPDESNLSFMIAQHYNASCLMVESKKADYLLKKCLSSNLPNIMLCKTNFFLDELRSFGECEHIDVVIVPDITQHFADNFLKALNAMLTFGDYIIIEAPRASNSLYDRVIQEFKKKGGILIDNDITENKLYVFKVQKKYLYRGRWNYTKTYKHGEYTVESNFIEKKFIKNKPNYPLSITPWHAGINLLTFKKLKGIYPTKKIIQSLLHPLISIEHNDLHIFNLIIQGKNLVPIDGDERGREHSVPYELDKILAQFRNNLFVKKMRELGII
jgi:hypothetical protein